SRRSCRQPPAGTSEPYRTRTCRGTGPGRAGHTPPRPGESRGGTAPEVAHGNGKHLRLAKMLDAIGCRSSTSRRPRAHHAEGRWAQMEILAAFVRKHSREPCDSEALAGTVREDRVTRQYY